MNGQISITLKKKTYGLMRVQSQGFSNFNLNKQNYRHSVVGQMILKRTIENSLAPILRIIQITFCPFHKKIQCFSICCEWNNINRREVEDYMIHVLLHLILSTPTVILNRNLSQNKAESIHEIGRFPMCYLVCAVPDFPLCPTGGV